MFPCIVFMLLLAPNNTIGTNDADNLVVRTASGSVEGYIVNAENGITYYAFEGIPYAEPPVDSLRFEEPVPIKPWNQTRVANRTNLCLQFSQLIPINRRESEYGVIGDEDCLYLNIFTKNLSSDYMQEVLVWLHGGAFAFGGRNENPQYLLRHDLVFVSISYRLGFLGFLSTEDEVVPGNNGLKDQNLALKWIKENIQFFGGNPNSITLMGSSAGAASVLYHYLSPMSVGLFQRGYAASGSPLCPWAQQTNSLGKTLTLVESFNCTGSNMRESVDCLKNIPASDLVKRHQIFKKFLFGPYGSFAPVVEKNTSNAFLSESPIDIFVQKKISNLPLLASIVADEGLYPTAEFVSEPGIFDDLDTRWEQIAPAILDYEYTIPRFQQSEISNTIRKFYLGQEKISNETFDSLTGMFGDRLFKVGIERTVQLLGELKEAPTFLINFDYESTRSRLAFGFTQNGKPLGVAHTDDLSYLFYHVIAPISSPEDLAIQNVLLDILWSFMKNGTVKVNNRNILSVSGLPNRIEYFHIENPKSLRMEVAETIANRQFWESIPFNENQLSIQVVDEMPSDDYTSCSIASNFDVIKSLLFVVFLIVYFLM